MIASDPLDVATELAEKERDHSIKKIRSRGSIKLTGYCLNCAEPRPTLFCDTDCRDDYEKLQKTRRLNGFKGIGEY
jgi:hypothetical protein